MQPLQEGFVLRASKTKLSSDSSSALDCHRFAALHLEENIHGLQD